MPKNNKYKSGDSPEDDEQKMPGRRFCEVNESSHEVLDGDDIGYFKRVAHESDIPRNELPLYRPARNRINALQQVNQRLDHQAEHIHNLSWQVKQLTDQVQRLTRSNLNQARDISRINTNELVILIGHMEREMELSGIKWIFELVGEPFDASIQRIADVFRMYPDTELLQVFRRDRAIQSLNAIATDIDFQNFYRVINHQVAHLNWLDVTYIKRLIRTLRNSLLTDEERFLCESAVRWFKRLLRVPYRDQLIEISIRNNRRHR